MSEDWRHDTWTVRRLIEALSKLNPDAMVVVDDEREAEDIENDVHWREMQSVVGLEVGYSDPNIVSGMNFSLEPIGDYLKPAVRLLSSNCDLTDPNYKITINGVSAAKTIDPTARKLLPAR